MGVPSVFARTAGCNLRCRWCDTPYASWEPEGQEMSPEAVAEVILGHPVSHVVITGGEPMIAPGISDLCARLHQEGRHITIETAGTIPPAGIACDLASLSPKLSHSTPGGDAGGWRQRHERERLKPPVLQQWAANYECQWKFVVAHPSDIIEIESVTASVGVSVPAHQILLMPEGVTSESLGSKREAILTLCKERGYRYCPRLHIDLFGNRRGT